MMWVRRMGIGCIGVVVGVKVRWRRRLRRIAVRVDDNGSIRVVPRAIGVMDGSIRVMYGSVGVVDGSVRIAGRRRERVVVVVLGIGKWDRRHGTGCCDEEQGEGFGALK